METKLYVGNLAYSATEDDLRRLFTQAGEVQSVNVIKDRDTGRAKGFAFVEMSTQAEPRKLFVCWMALHFTTVLLRSISPVPAKIERATGVEVSSAARGDFLRALSFFHHRRISKVPVSW
jgi:hypothetical protein